MAPQARLRGFNFLSFPVQSAYLDALGMSSENPQSDDVHVFTMSFGSSGGATNVTPDEREMFRVGVNDLRDGRGALYLKAAGNQFEDCTRLDEDGELLAPGLDLSAEIGCSAANLDGDSNLPYVIVTGGFNADGRRSSYSAAGASLWVVAPAGERGADHPAMITTDQMGADRGYTLIPRGLSAGAEGNPLGDYTSIFNGTSAAAPMAAGVVALLLETQPALTWRDVKHILARTGAPTGCGDPARAGGVRRRAGGAAARLDHQCRRLPLPQLVRLRRHRRGCRGGPCRHPCPGQPGGLYRERPHPPGCRHRHTRPRRRRPDADPEGRGGCLAPPTSKRCSCASR